ncbi:PTS glucose transporter subunit IIA [Lactiplantibacillus paraxiangfangensis]|uniref:PTS glucose transporter subunit IIA n=2 Tax=Lactiplantibacillus paraxiangfangensis TaxID=3076224 RepID=UPI0030C700FC
MMMKLFQRKRTVTLAAPVNGMYVDLRKAGETAITAGFAVEPMEGEIHAPIAGQITAVTAQTVTIAADFGCDYLVQIGDLTANLDDQAVNWQVAVGDAVSVDVILANVSIETIHAANQSALVTCGLIGKQAADFEISQTGLISQGNQLATLKIKA